MGQPDPAPVKLISRVAVSKGRYLLARNRASRAAALGLLLLVLMLAVPALSAGYEALAKGPGAATADPAAVLLGQVPRPAIRPSVRQGLSQSPGLPGQNISSNWSGYVVSSDTGSVTDVNGSWIVPSVLCSRFQSFSAAWVGIDGWSDSTVEQTGTESDCLSGTPIYYAWYEFYPSESVLINITVSAGDVILAGVSCQTGGLRCTVSITDANSSKSFSYGQTFGPGSGPQMSSADWIVEAPSSPSGQPLPLAAFGTVYSGQDWTTVSPSDSATINGTSGPIGSFGAAGVEVAMVASDGSTLAQPSGLSPDGTSFSVARNGSGHLTISCDPATVAVGSATTCEATVPDSPEPTGIVAWSSDRAGKFSSLKCRLSDGACLVKFTPTTASSSVILTASYGGDFEDLPSTGTYGLVVVSRATSTAVSCTPKSAIAGSSTVITCTAKVAGYSPTGTVSWSQSGTGSVSIGSTSCILSQGVCSVTATGFAGGQVTINATYAGDPSNQASSHTASLTVKRASTAVATACSQSSIGVGSNVTCAATVSGGYSSHSGTVTWSQASGKGGVTFSSTTCTLSSGSCSVTVTATVAGSVKIEAAYGGDADDQGSSRAAGLTITKAATVLTLSCTESTFSTGVPVTCTAAVSGADSSITGTVTWSKVSGRITFSSTTCSLSSGSCSMTVTVAAPGSVEIKAAYGGDSNDLKSSGTLVLTVS